MRVDSAKHIAKDKGVLGDEESEGSRRQPSGLTDRNHIRHRKLGKVAIQTEAQNYPEAYGVDVADRWKERLRSYPGGSYGRGNRVRSPVETRFITECYKWVVNMDLEKYFDTVNQSKLVQILSETIEDGRVISLIHKFLRAYGADMSGFKPSRQALGFHQAACVAADQQLLSSAVG